MLVADAQALCVNSHEGQVHNLAGGGRCGAMAVGRLSTSQGRDRARGTSLLARSSIQVLAVYVGLEVDQAYVFLLRESIAIRLGTEGTAEYRSGHADGETICGKDIELLRHTPKWSRTPAN